MSESIKRRYLNLHQTAAYVNDILNLKGKDIISYYTIQHWRKKGVVSYTILTGSRAKINEQDLQQILGFAYLHVYLGISYDKLKETQDYLKLIVNGSISTFQHLAQYTPLYANKK